MEHLKNAIKRPFTDFKKLIIGILLSILPVVNFMALGYQVRCAKTAGKLPEWNKFGNLFVTGLLAGIIMLIYVLPGAIIFGVTLFAAVAASLPGLQELTSEGGVELLTSALASINFGPLIGVMLLGLVVLFLGGLFGASAVIRYSQRLNFSDGFSGEVFRKAFTGKFFWTWILAGIYGFILSLILSFIPSVGILDFGGSIKGFIYGVTYMSALGIIYKRV